MVKRAKKSVKTYKRRLFRNVYALNMILAFGWQPNCTLINMDSTKVYFPEQLMEMSKRYHKLPMWLRFDSKMVEIKNMEQLDLACRLVCEYHKLLRDPQEIFSLELEEI